MGESDELTRHRFHILAALAATDLHGSGIVRDVLEQTGGGLRLWPATLYRTLEELESEGLISELTGTDRPEGVSERRRYYRISTDGRAALQREVERMNSMAAIAESRLGRA